MHSSSVAKVTHDRKLVMAQGLQDCYANNNLVVVFLFGTAGVAKV
jgi:hypothetical protein